MWACRCNWPTDRQDMHASTDRLDFAPPNTPGGLRALILALVVHGLLLAALAWGVRWTRDTQILSAEAEIWSAVPQEAAPRLAEPPPEPVKPLPPAPPPRPAPPQPVATPPAPPPPQVDIALEKEKLRRQKEQARLEALKQEKLQQKLEQERLDKAKLEKTKLEKARLEALKLDKLKQDKLKQDKLKQDELKQEKQLAEQAQQAKQAALDKKKAALQAKQVETQRQQNLQRMASLAGASGDSNASGTALKSAGPSANYGGRIRAKIKPNIVFTEEIRGNPTAIVEVRTAPDGTIISSKLTQSSGVPSWDAAVIRAIDKTETLPRDVDGRVPSLLSLEFRPKD